MHEDSSVASAATSGPVARIDPAALVHNYREVRRLVGRRVAILAMIKADGYGHGASVCASALAEAGCTDFGVATIDEAVAIASNVGGPPARRIVFGGLLPFEADAAVASGAEIVTQEIDVVRALGQRASAAGREVAVHLKIDTGMARLGMAPADAAAFAEAARPVRGVRLVGLCSHFAQAESVTGQVTAGQLEALLAADQALRDSGVVLTRHLANSAGILTRPDTHLDMVRPGIMLYGVVPDPSLAGRADLRPVMTLVARVVRVADVGPGQGVGYAHTFHAKRPTKIATVRCGYADGYPRALGNVAVASVRGVRVPLIGRVCMDHAMFDVTDVADVAGVALGDEVILWGDDPHVEEISSLAGTIGYELLARVGARVRRETIGPGQGH